MSSISEGIFYFLPCICVVETNCFRVVGGAVVEGVTEGSDITF